MTYNVYSLLHLARSHWGPLWAHNAFSFESGNGDLLKVIHATKGSHTVKHFYNHVGTTLVQKSLQISEIRYFDTAFHVDRNCIEKLHLFEQAVTYNLGVFNVQVLIIMKKRTGTIRTFIFRSFKNVCQRFASTPESSHCEKKLFVYVIDERPQTIRQLFRTIR